MAFSKIKHVLWDWNGTLIDDAFATYEILIEIVRHYKQKEISYEEYREVFCLPVVNFYRKIGFEIDKIDMHEMSQMFHSRYHDRVPNMKLHAQAKQALEGVNKKGLKQSILSAHPQEKLEFAVSQLGIGDYFQGLFGATSNQGVSKIEHSKTWFKNSGMNPEHLILIGDTDHDGEVAKELGIDCILIDIGHQNRKVLERTGFKVLNDLGELVRLIPV